jgi:aspartate racemase
VAWPSTVEYYSEICRRCAPATPEMSIESLDHNKAVSYLGIDGDEESWRRFDEYHRTALQRVEASGADFAIIASNTPHHRLESIVTGVKIPVLSIFEAAAKQCARIGVTQVLILGTAVTMGSSKLRDAFARQGIEAAGPRDQAARAMTIELIEDLQLGKMNGSAERLSAIANSALRGHSAVCLACTDLPAAFPESRSNPTFEVDGVVYINTSVVHALAAVEFALS